MSELGLRVRHFLCKYSRLLLPGITQSSGKVGIGTAAPLSLLDVSGTAQLHGAGNKIGLYVNSSGNVGIGMNGPATALQVGTGGTDEVRLGAITFNTNTGNKIDE